MAGLTPDQKAFYEADLAQVTAAIDMLQQNIVEQNAAITDAQTQINVAQAQIAADEEQLGSESNNLTQDAVDALNQNIAESQASIEQNQIVIQQATNNINVDQTQLDEQQLYQERDIEALGATTSPDPVGNQSVNPVAYDDNGNLLPGYQLDENGNPVYVGGGTPPTVFSPSSINSSTVGVNGVTRTAASATAATTNGVAQQIGVSSIPNVIGAISGSTPLTPEQTAAINQAATLTLAQQQQTLSLQRNQNNNADWRLKLSLAPGSDYLYNASAPGILLPLFNTGGVIFPYTPVIDTSYRANYSSYDLTHSNYRGYFYQNSYVDQITIRAQFTAQSTADADYLLAVIHFFRSVTKMFYGQDSQRGSPPPIVYLNGYGAYQFSNHACLVSNFTYNLPADVDYIRADTASNLGLNQVNQRNRAATSTTTSFNSTNRLASVGLPLGAINTTPERLSLTTTAPTYVPTKMEINLTLLPVQSRQQVSQNFSVKSFATGQLLNGGFW